MLKELICENELKELKTQIINLEKEYKSRLKEGVLDFDNTDLSYVFDEAKKRYMAAKKGLAISNKLRDPEQKKMNQARVMSNLNKLRAFLANLTKTIQNEVEAIYQQQSNKELFQQRPSANVRYNSEFNSEA
jgi:hypothetical protein